MSKNSEDLFLNTQVSFSRTKLDVTLFNHWLKEGPPTFFQHTALHRLAWNYVQAVRGLLMCGLTIGFFAVVCCFVGMECTYIGGSDKTKDKVLFAGAVLHFVGGMSDIAAYCLYINRIARTAFARRVASGVLRYELGPPVFLGLAGCFFILVGAVLYAVTVYKVIRRGSRVVQADDAHTYMAPPSRGRTIYSGYYKPSKLNGSNYMGSGRSSAQLSKLSQATPTKPSDRDAFV